MHSDVYADKLYCFSFKFFLSTLSVSFYCSLGNKKPWDTCLSLRQWLMWACEHAINLAVSWDLMLCGTFNVPSARTTRNRFIPYSIGKSFCMFCFATSFFFLNKKGERDCVDLERPYRKGDKTLWYGGHTRKEISFNLRSERVDRIGLLLLVFQLF